MGGREESTTAGPPRHVLPAARLADERPTCPAEWGEAARPRTVRAVSRELLAPPAGHPGTAILAASPVPTDIPRARPADHRGRFGRAGARFDAVQTRLYNRVMARKKNVPGEVRERILQTACDLFYSKGINNVGVDVVVARSGVAKMSLYKHFGSKDELVRAYVERWEERWLALLERGVEARASTPRSRLIAVFDFLEEEFRDPDFRGCARVNAAIELADAAHPAHGACREKKEGVREYLRGLAEDAGLPDPDGLSKALSVLLNGAIVTALVEGGPGAAKAARRTASALLRDA